MKKNVTIQLIAEEAGVSTATVSRVLASSPLVGEKTRERVQSLIDRYQFTPNPAARSLVRSRSGMLGMLVQDISNPYFSEMYLEAEKAAVEKDYTLLLASSLSFENEKKALLHMRERKVEGILMISSSIDSTQRISEVSDCILSVQQTTPIILINEPIAGLAVPFVSASNVSGYTTAMDHLFSLGHREIAFIGGSDHNATMCLRHSAYTDAFARRGLTPDPALTCMLGYSHEDGYRGMMQIFASGRIPTAVICANDVTAMGVLRACFAQRLSVPEDISLVSCDNTFISKATYPALTSIDICPGAQGTTAMETLLQLIRGEEVPPVTHVPCHMIIRGSTAKARGMSVTP